MTLLAAVLLTAIQPAPSTHSAITDCRPVWQRESDAFRRTAHKALSGQFGILAPWQATGYRAGLAKGATCSRAITLTAYYGTEASGRIDGHGRKQAMGTQPEATWLTEARKRLEELPEKMRDVEKTREELNRDAQECTSILNAYRAEERKLRRLLDGIDGDGEAEEAQDDV